MNRKRGSFYTKIAPNLLGEITLEKPLLQAYKNAGGVLFGEYVVLESLARCTREKESMHYALGKKLLPTPIASDAFALRRFTISTQIATHKNHQKRLYPYIVDFASESGWEIMDLIVEIYEEMMAFPQGWSRSTP